MTLSVSEMKVRLEDYLTDASKDAVENACLFADIAEDERLPDTIRREAEEQWHIPPFPGNYVHLSHRGTT